MIRVNWLEWRLALMQRNITIGWEHCKVSSCAGQWESQEQNLLEMCKRQGGKAFLADAKSCLATTSFLLGRVWFKCTNSLTRCR